MSKFVPTAILSVAALLSGTAAFATTTKPVAASKTTVTTHTATVAKPAPRVAAVTTKSGAHIVTAKTVTGKTVHYDCSKAGNATKTACKK